MTPITTEQLGEARLEIYRYDPSVDRTFYQFCQSMFSGEVKEVIDVGVHLPDSDPLGLTYINGRLITTVSFPQDFSVHGMIPDEADERLKPYGLSLDRITEIVLNQTSSEASQ